VVSYEEPQSVALSGGGSFDPDGDELTFQWTQLAGPPVTLMGADTAGPVFVTPAISSDATVRFQLVVHDGEQAGLPAEVTVVLAPVAIPTSASTVKTPVTVKADDGSATIQICWPGTPGELAVIQASGDLIHWETIATNAVGYLSLLLHTDLAAGTHPHRFYRATSAPAP
jgi:hypothetical protein